MDNKPKHTKRKPHKRETFRSSINITTDCDTLVTRLQEDLGIATRSQVFELAVRHYAKESGVSDE